MKDAPIGPPFTLLGRLQQSFILPDLGPLYRAEFDNIDINVVQKYSATGDGLGIYSVSSFYRPVLYIPISDMT
jgi:hypothetical protein